MNINLLSSSDSVKTSQSNSPVDGKESESNSEEGFFSKLTALIKGESSSDAGESEAGSSEVSETKANATQEGTDEKTVDGKVVEDGESESGADTKLVKVEEEAELGKLASSSSEAELQSKLTENGEKVSQDSDTKHVVSTQEDKSASASHKASEQPNSELTRVNQGVNTDSESQAKPAQAKNIVEENEQVLKRLQQSSDALTDKGGKVLPESNSDTLISQQTNTSNLAKEIGASDGSLNQTSENAKLSDLGNNSEALLSESYQRLPSETMNDEIQQKVNAAELLAETRTLSEEEKALEQLPESVKRFVENAQHTEQSHSSHSIPSASVADVPVVLSAEELVRGEALLTQMQMGEITDIAQLAERDQALVAAVVRDKQLNLTVAQQANNLTGSTLVGGSGGEPVNNLVSSGSIQPTMAQTNQMSSNLPSSASLNGIPVEMTEAMNDAELQKLRGANSSMAQSVQQALQTNSTPLQSNIQLNVSNSASLVQSPIDAAMLSTQAAQIAPAVNVAVDNQLASKALMAGKFAGKIAKSEINATSSQGQASESQFAQQLSQVAGQQGLSNINQAGRVDNAQPPLQLSRDMAGEQLAERVQMMLSKNLKNIDIRLDPPELGRLQIRMNIGADGTSVHFVVANQQARDVVEQAMPRLREMLSQQGIQMNESSVQQQNQGRQSGQYAAEQDGSGQGNNSSLATNAENLEPDINLDLNVLSKRDGISYYA